MKNWKPQGQLITTIYEHSDVVSCIETIRDSRFFVTGGYDGYARVFDPEKIES